MRLFLVIATLGAVVLVSCSHEATTPLRGRSLVVPANMPPIDVPADNPMTLEKAELGRHLFYEERLSRDLSVSCASCHSQETAFSDAPNQVSEGFEGEQGQRNSPTIVNVAYRKVLFWDGRAATLEEQAMEAFMNMAEMAADTFAVAELLRSAEYANKWYRAFGDTAVTMKRTMQAIATFERTILSANSRYDSYIRGDTSVFSNQEKEGLQLFFDDRTMCFSCHGGFDLTDDEFHSVGLFHHYFDKGRYNVTRDPNDEGRFKTPTLRNIALTAPYMASGDNQKGLLETLEDVMKHYNDGGTTFHSKDERVKELFLTDEETDALVAFLKTLTDSTVLTESRFAKP